MNDFKEIETPFHNDPFDYKFSVDEDGVRKATNPLNNLVVLNDGETKIVQRRIIRVGAKAGFDSILIGSLDGVKVYIKGNDIILTKQDLLL